MKRTILSLLILAALHDGASAQDSNYWDTQYGTKGGMLGGLVVGSPSDLSATFYNPGWIALDHEGAFLLTTQALEAYRVDMDEGAEDGLDITSTKMASSPDYLAGRFTLDPARTWSWAYSYLKRIQFDLDSRGVAFDPGPQPPAADDWFSGEVFRRARADEYWYGLTAATQLKSNVALGFTPYVVYRSVQSRFQTAAQESNPQGDFAQTYFADDYRFYHLRMLMKIGLAVDHGDWKLGLTATTPSLGIMGRGEQMVHFTVSGVDRDGDGAIDPTYLANNFQEDLTTHWQSPLSLAAGVTWKRGRTGVHLTAEWFDAVSARRAMEPEPFLDQTSGEEVVTDLSFVARRVFNYGIGFEHEFTPDVSVYGSFRSDFTSNPSDGTNHLALSSWDLWHVTGGVAFRFFNMEFNTGLQYSWGSRDAQRFAGLDPDIDGGDLLETGDFAVTYQRIKVLVGFDLPALGLTD